MQMKRRNCGWACLLPVSGPLAFVGSTKKRALDLLVEQINERGGMNGHKIKVFFYDTESNTTLVSQQFRRLAESDKVDIVVGPTVTGETLVARPVANELKVPMVPFAGTEAVINPVTPYMFAFIPSDRHVARKMLALIKAKGLKSVAFLHSADGFGQTGLRVMKELSTEMGIKLATVEEFGPRDSDMTPQVMRIRASGADAMFVWGVNPGPTIIMKNAQAIGFNKPIVNSYGVASQHVHQPGRRRWRRFLCRRHRHHGRAADGCVQPGAQIDREIRQGLRAALQGTHRRFCRLRLRRHAPGGAGRHQGRRQV